MSALGHYARAIQLFEEGSGEDARKYVFQSEWNSLSTNNQGRYVLAVLALHGEPLSFDDIVVHQSPLPAALKREAAQLGRPRLH